MQILFLVSHWLMKASQMNVQIISQDLQCGGNLCQFISGGELSLEVLLESNIPQPTESPDFEAFICFSTPEVPEIC